MLCFFLFINSIILIYNFFSTCNDNGCNVPGEQDGEGKIEVK